MSFFCIFRHLRHKHCTQEGGSFVCRYGDNKVCCTLPVEGVSDADYEQHVYKHHAFSTPNVKIRKYSGASVSSNHSRSQSSDGYEKWTIYSASQNLPAVLNDPGKGKQVCLNYYNVIMIYMCLINKITEKGKSLHNFFFILLTNMYWKFYSLLVVYIRSMIRIIVYRFRILI